MLIQVALIFLFGLIGGGFGFAIGAPLPFMLGGIVGTASFVMWYERHGRALPELPRWVRLVFMAIIGTAIGSRFSPEYLEVLPHFWISCLAILPYILLAHGGGFALMRYVGRYERNDAYFASLPGGIIDSAALAQEAGPDVRVVTAQHFMRIILVVLAVPLLFLVIEGNSVGSAVGVDLPRETHSFSDIVLILTIAGAGLVMGRALRLPISHMLGPLIVAGLVSVSGLVEINMPDWLTHFAQYVVGTTLGAQFSGMSRKLLLRGFSMGILAGAYMLLLAAGFATLLSPLVPAEFSVMFVSFTAGGLTEMSLIALSLGFSPVVVLLHHLLRILFTILLAPRLAPWVIKSKP